MVMATCEPLWQTDCIEVNAAAEKDTEMPDVYEKTVDAFDSLSSLADVKTTAVTEEELNSDKLPESDAVWEVAETPELSLWRGSANRSGYDDYRWLFLRNKD